MAIHTLSRHVTQVPFRKISIFPGRHISIPIGHYFHGHDQMIRCYDLQKMELSKTIQRARE